MDVGSIWAGSGIRLRAETLPSDRPADGGMAPGWPRLGVLSVAPTTAALLAIETAPCARSSSLLSRTRLASASSTGVTCRASRRKSGPRKYLAASSQALTCPGAGCSGKSGRLRRARACSCGGDITKDPREVVIDDLPAFGRGNMWELLELVVPRFAADLIARVFRHGNDHRRRPGQDAG